jgi:TetR/AcrR family transcriptional repressor of mexJK operon
MIGHTGRQCVSASERGGLQMNRKKAEGRFANGPGNKKELEVLDVASDYFLAHGYQGTSINAMARDSGISKESIYRYFSSKKDLFEAVIAKELAVYQDKLHSGDFEFNSVSLQVALTRMAESILGVVSTDRTLGLRRLVFQDATQYPDIGKYYFDIGPREAYRNLEKLFVIHKHRSSLSPQKLSRYFISMLLHYRMLLRECGILKPLSKSRVKSVAKDVTKDFIDAFMDRS